MGLRAGLGTQLASLAAPGATDGATTEALRKVALDGAGALAVTMVEEADFLPGVDAGGFCNREIRRRRSARTSAIESDVRRHSVSAIRRDLAYVSRPM